MQSKNIVFKVSDNIKDKVIDYYKDLKKDKTPPYAIFQAVEADTVVTLYESGKLMFQGISADIDANMWIDQEKHLNNRTINVSEKDKKKEKKENIINPKLHNISSMGSDEVGTGDFFGPIVVTATFVDKKVIPKLEELGIRDSKKITDEKILKIAPEIIKFIPYTTYILTNEQYNKIYSEEMNMNRIKAVLHNKVLYNLNNKEKYDYDKIVIDQFVYPQKYFEHIKDAVGKITNITFLTHAEDQVLSVACASVISRYIFLKEMDKLTNLVGVKIPKGSGVQADITAKIILEKHGLDYFTKIAKLNFKNYNKLKETKDL